MNKQNNVWKRVAAWTLAASMVVGSNSFTVLAESMPDAELSELEAGEFAEGFLAETEGEDGTADEWQEDSFTDGEEAAEVADGFTSGETEELEDFTEEGEEEEPNDLKNTLTFAYPDDVPQMLPNSEMEVPVHLYHSWYEEESGECSEEVNSFELRFHPDENNWSYNTDLIDVEFVSDEEGRPVVKITSRGKTGYTDIHVGAYVDGEEWATESLHVGVTDSYAVLTADDMGNPLVGETLDLNEKNIEVCTYPSEENQESTETDTVTFDVIYDNENAWLAEQTDVEKLPRLTRIDNENTGFTIIAYKDGEEIARRHFVFDYISYDVWFENIRGEDSSWIFSNEEACELDLNMDNLEGKNLAGNVEIHWYVSESDESGNGTEAEEGGFWSRTEKGISIDGTQMGDSGYDVIAQVVVRIDALDNPVEVSRCETFIEKIEAEENLEYDPRRSNLFRREGLWINNTYWGYLKNADHPWGEGVEVTIDSLSVTDIECYDEEYDEEEDQICRIEEHEGGWNLVGEFTGEVSVHIEGHVTEEEESGIEVKQDFSLWIQDSMFYAEAELPNGTGQMLPGETVEISVKVYSEDHDSSTGRVTKKELDSSEYDIRWRDEDGNAWYDGNILEIEEGEKAGTIKITAKKTGDTDLYIGAFGKDADGNTWEVDERARLYIRVEDGNPMIRPADLDGRNPKVGEELDLNAYNPSVVVRSYSEEGNPESGITEEELDRGEIRFRLEGYDFNAWEIKEGTQEDEIPVLIRRGDWQTEVTLVAEKKETDDYGTEYYDEVARQTYYFGLTEETCRYDIDYADVSLFVGEEKEVDPYINCWVRNDTYPDGRNVKVEVTNVEVHNAEDEESTEDICELYVPDPADEESDGIWRAHANRVGHAVMTVSYMDLEGEEQSYTVNIFVSTDKYDLYFEYPEDTECLLKNSEGEFRAHLYHSWKYEADMEDGEEVKNFTLKFNKESGDSFYSEELLEAPEILKDESGRETIVKLRSRNSGDNEWGFVNLDAYVENEDGSSARVWSGNLNVYITDNYTTMLPGNLGDLQMLQVGEVLDLNKVGLQVLRYENGEGKPVENVTFDVQYDEYSNEDGYDSGDWKDISEEGDELPRLIRMSSGEIEIIITAYQHDEETGENVNVGERTYHFSELDYSPELVNDRSVIFSNETGENSYCMELNTENLENKKNIQVEWGVGSFVENEETEETEWIPLEIKDPFWKADGTRLYIDGKEMYAAGESSEYIVRASVCVEIEGEEKPLVVNENFFDIWAREPVYDYWNLMDHPTFFYDASFFVPNYLIYHIEDGEHPSGENVRIPVDITKVETIEAYGYDGDNLPELCTLKEEPGEGWWLEGKRCGKGAVSYTYTDLDGKVQNRTEEFWTENYIRYIKTDLEENALNLLIDEEKEITLSVIGETHDPETGKVTTEVIPASDYEIFLQDYDRNSVDARIAEDGKLHIQAVSDESDTVVSVYARSTDPEDEWKAILPNGIYVVPAAAFYTINMEKNLENVWPELTDTFNLSEYAPYVMCRAYDEEGKIQETRMNGIQFRLDYEEDKWRVLEGTEEKEIPTLVRTSTDETEIALYADVVYVDEYGREQREQVAEWKYWFGGLYDINGEHSWTEGVVTKEPTCEEAGSKEYLCKSCGETRTEEIPAFGHTWNLTATVTSTCVAEGYHVYTCETCKQTKREVIPKLAHNMVTVIDSVATCGTVGKQHQECSACGGVRTELPDTPATGAHSWKENGVVAATCTTAGSRNYICETCGQTRSETIPATGTHTWGAYVVTEAATAVKEGIETHTCSVCGQTESRSVARLNAYVKVTESTFPMKRGQTFTLPVTMESGDYIESVISKNTKRITVSWEADKVTLKAKKKAKTGKVKVTIKTKGGASTTIIVKLQKGTVAAKKILGIPGTATLKVKKTLKLQPVVSPISYQTKVSYSTSNKKVATVNKKGKITAKKAGTAIIKVTCGKITKKCKVTVTKK